MLRLSYMVDCRTTLSKTVPLRGPRVADAHVSMRSAPRNDPMKKRYAILAMLCFAGVLSSVLSLALSRREPRYEGKRISHWINHLQATQSNDSQVSHIFDSVEVSFKSRGMTFDPGQIVFPKVDSNAVPYLIKALDRPSGRLSHVYCLMLSKLPECMQRRLPVPKVVRKESGQLAVLEVLRRLDAQAMPAIPKIADLVRRDESDVVRLYAVYGLTRFATNDKRAATALEQAMNEDRNILIRLKAAAALHRDASEVFQKARATVHEAPPPK